MWSHLHWGLYISYTINKALAHPPKSPWTGNFYLKVHVLIRLTSRPVHTHLKAYVLVTPTVKHIYWSHSNQALCIPTSRPMYSSLMYWSHSPQSICSGHTYIESYILVTLTTKPMHTHLKVHELFMPTSRFMFWTHSPQGPCTCHSFLKVHVLNTLISRPLHIYLKSPAYPPQAPYGCLG